MDFNTPLSTAHLKNAIESKGLSSTVQVCSWNLIPQYVGTFPKFFIMNTDNSYSSGSHWTVIFLPSDTALSEYFDSFGKPPRNNIIKLNDFVYNQKRIQNIFSSICGHYCLLFVWYRLKLKHSLNSFVDEMRKMNEREIFALSKSIFFPI